MVTKKLVLANRPVASHRAGVGRHELRVSLDNTTVRRHVHAALGCKTTPRILRCDVDDIESRRLDQSTAPHLFLRTMFTSVATASKLKHARRGRAAGAGDEGDGHGNAHDGSGTAPGGNSRRIVMADDPPDEPVNQSNAIPHRGLGGSSSPSKFKGLQSPSSRIDQRGVTRTRNKSTVQVPDPTTTPVPAAPPCPPPAPIHGASYYRNHAGGGRAEDYEGHTGGHAGGHAGGGASKAGGVRRRSFTDVRRESASAIAAGREAIRRGSALSNNSPGAHRVPSPMARTRQSDDSNFKNSSHHELLQRCVFGIIPTRRRYGTCTCTPARGDVGGAVPPNSSPVARFSLRSHFVLTCRALTEAAAECLVPAFASALIHLTPDAPNDMTGGRSHRCR